LVIPQQGDGVPSLPQPPPPPQPKRRRQAPNLDLFVVSRAAVRQHTLYKSLQQQLHPPSPYSFLLTVTAEQAQQLPAACYPFIPQGTEAWHAIRGNHLSASNLGTFLGWAEPKAAKVLGCSSWASHDKVVQLCQQLRPGGAATAWEPTAAMQWGTKHEDNARYTLLTHLQVSFWRSPAPSSAQRVTQAVSTGPSLPYSSIVLLTLLAAWTPEQYDTPLLS
jgi:hypothetical protein